VGFSSVCLSVCPTDVGTYRDDFYIVKVCSASKVAVILDFFSLNVVTKIRTVTSSTGTLDNASVTLGRHAARHAGRHAWRRRDSVDRRSYLMFIMLITCQSLFKKDDKVVACVAGAAFLMIAGAVQFQRRRRRKRNVWEKPWIQVRPVSGAYSTLISDLRNTDEFAFRNYLRINVAASEDLLSRFEHVVVKQRTRWRATICPRESPVSHHYMLGNW